MNIKFCIETLKFCQANKVYGEYINIALGQNKLPRNVKESINYLKIRYGKKGT